MFLSRLVEWMLGRYMDEVFIKQNPLTKGDFISNFFTFAMLGTWRATEGTSEPAKTLFYASIDGIQIGLCKAVLATSGTTPFGAPDPNAGNALPIPPPNLWGTLAIMLFITLGSLFLAWRRIRAVEVV
jgi:hypothetical protein